MSFQLSWSRGEIFGDFRSWNVSKDSNSLHNTDHDSECIIGASKKQGEGRIKVGFDQCVAPSLPFTGLFIWNDSCHHAS